MSEKAARARLQRNQRDDPVPEALTACGETPAAFERRCIPPEPRRSAALCVAFRSKYTRYSSLTRLVSRAPLRSRRSPGFHHRLLTACGKTHAAQFSRWGLDRRSPVLPVGAPAEPLRFAALCVALRSKYTRASSPGGGSSLTRLVSRAPRPHREDWPVSALTWVSPQAVNTTCGKERKERNDRAETGRQAGPTGRTDRADRQTGPKPPYRPGRSPSTCRRRGRRSGSSGRSRASQSPRSPARQPSSSPPESRSSRRRREWRAR